ncbi:MAG: hypothetical protein K9N40_04305 [Candidatus Cloacimonetes bacterium]|nr:hypothetical protein [Candidatus Cloacimonadota bacterium]
MSNEQIKKVNLIDIFIVLAKRKKIIILVTLIVSILSVLFVLIIPQYWVSKATIKPVTDNNQGLNISSALMGLGSSFLNGNVTTSSIDFVSIMNSRTFSEDVVKHFDLATYFEIVEEDPYRVMETATALLQESIMSFYVSPETGIIHIYAETKDRLLSKEIVDYYVKKIEEYNLTVQKSKGRQKRIFLESRIEEIESKMDELKLRMQNFQEKNRVLEIDSQIRGAIDLYSSLLKKQLELEMEIVSYNELYPEGSAKLKILELSLSEIDKKIKGLESGSDYKYMLGMENVPELANSYSSLYSQLEINKTLYEFIFPQLESARLEELKDLPSLEIIDEGNIAGYRSKPKRARFCIIMFLSAIIISSTLVIISQYTSDEQKVKIRKFWKILFSKE